MGKKLSLADLAAAVDSNNIQLSDNRMAGEIIEVTPSDLKELLKPYDLMSRDKSQPNYIGRTEDEWKEDNKRVRQDVLDLERRARPKAEAREYLASQGFLIPQEQDLILQNLHKKPILHTEAVHTPNAASDELLSRALLHHQGWSPVTPANDDVVMATDISARIDGVKSLIDAQTRTSPTAALNLAVVHNDPGIYDALRRNPNVPLIDFIAGRAANNKRAYEGKLLHTPDSHYNPLQTARFMRDADNHRKDYLISSNRAGDSTKGMNRGPYSPELPRGWNLIDLQVARDKILRRSLNQLPKGIRLNNYDGGSQLNLGISPGLLDRLSNPNIDMDSEVLRRLSK